jgi:hypothetical protein
MNRSCLAVLFLLCSAAASRAGVVGLTSTVLPPFTVDTGLTGHTGYVLSAMTDDGSVIAAVEVNITGQLHQRWFLDPDENLIVKTPTSASLTSGDSHLTPGPDVLIAVAPVEDNSGSGSPLADTLTRDYGYGTFLRGVWGIPGPSRTNQITLGYIVIPDGSLPSLSITAQIAIQKGDEISAFTLNGADFFDVIPPPPTIPVLRSSPVPGPGIELYLDAFGTPGQNPPPQPVRLWNSGTGEITINNILLAGPDALKYILVGTLPTSLVGGAPVSTFGVDWAAPGQSFGTDQAQLFVLTSHGNLVFDISYLRNPNLPPDDDIIPEPSALVLVGLAIGGFALRCRS